MGVIEEDKKFICKYSPHEHVCVESPKVELRCHVVKTWVTADVLLVQTKYLCTQVYQFNIF